MDQIRRSVSASRGAHTDVRARDLAEDLALLVDLKMPIKAITESI